MFDIALNMSLLTIYENTPILYKKIFWKKEDQTVFARRCDPES